MTESLSKLYGAVRALDRVSLRVPKGSIFGFLGPNGAGKSTTIRILLGLMRASGGTASILGLDCWRDSVAIRRRLGYLPGDIRFYDGMSGRSTLRFLAGTRRTDCRAEVGRLADRFELDLRRKVRGYSKGMKQKLGLIQALMHRPEVLVLDEPTSSLDPLVQQTLYDELRQAALRGTTVLFSSHTLSEVEALCEFVAIVRRGQLVEQDTIQNLRARAVRHVEYSLRDAAVAAPPVGLTLRGQHKRRYLGTWGGPVGPLLNWLAQAPIEDVTIGPPDLEELFMSYYSTDAMAPAASELNRGAAPAVQEAVA